MSTATVRAADWICSRKGFAKGSVALSKAAKRRAEGIISRMSWTFFPPSSEATPATPVTFPPGRARLATSPVSMGLPAGAMTIGIAVVAAFAARAAGVNWATIARGLGAGRIAGSCALDFPFRLDPNLCGDCVGAPTTRGITAQRASLDKLPGDGRIPTGIW